MPSDVRTELAVLIREADTMRRLRARIQRESALLERERSRLAAQLELQRRTWSRLTAARCALFPDDTPNADEGSTRDLVADGITPSLVPTPSSMRQCSR